MFYEVYTRSFIATVIKEDWSDNFTGYFETEKVRLERGDIVLLINDETDKTSIVGQSVFYSIRHGELAREATSLFKENTRALNP